MAQSQPPAASATSGVLAGIARLEGPLREALEEGIAHQRERRFREAEAAYRRAVALNPDSADALNLLGTLVVAVGGTSEGARLLRRAVMLRPEDAGLRANLAAILVVAERVDEALGEIEAASKLAPEALDVALNQAGILRQLGRAAEALAVYDRIIASHPGHALARIGAGRCHADLGHRAEAAATFRAAAVQQPNDPIAPIELAALGLPEDAGQLPRLLALAEAKVMAPATRTAVVYAAARICEDLGRHDEAIAHAQNAKTMRRPAEQADGVTAFVNRLVGTFDGAMFAAKKGYGDPSARPVFVVGLPRSGTAAVARMLGSHPQVAVAGELPRMPLLTAAMAEIQLVNQRYPESLREATPEAMRRLAARYLEQLMNTSAEAARVVDPLATNFEQLGLIALLFPNARIVNCRRDPLDVGVSCYLHNFPEGGVALQEFAQIGLFIREYERLMLHWRRLLPSPMHEVSYEDLTSAPERVLRQLVDVMGLPWDDRCLAAIGDGSPLQAALARDPAGRSQRYEKHVAPLREALGR